MCRHIGSIVFGSLLVVVAGCPDWGTSDPARAFTRLGGRVLNGETQLPVSGVTVKICNYEFSASTNGDGHWFMEIVPGLQDTDIVLTFERSGLASIGFRVNLDPDDESFMGAIENRFFLDIGTHYMRAGASATVQVTLEGAPFGSATLFAAPEDFQFDNTDCSDLNIVVTANASGAATIPNLDPNRHYMLVVPTQDIDGDSVPDTQTRTTNINISQEGSVYGIDVERWSPFASPSITGSNLGHFDITSFSLPTGPVNDTVRSFGSFGLADLNSRSSSLNEEVFFFDAVTTASGSTSLVFRTPVNVISATGLEPNFLFRDNLRDPTMPGYNVDVRIPATVAALAGSNSTVWTFTPTSPLPTNEVVTLNFIARSNVDPDRSANLEQTFYVPILGNTTIAVRADNYNGSRDGTGGSNQVYLTFDEAIEGFYKVRSFVIDNSTVTIESPFEILNFSFDDDAIVHNVVAAPLTGSNVGQSGAVAGNAYTVRVRAPSTSQLFLNDDATTANSITIEISVSDAEGNRRDEVMTLPIQ